MFIFSVNEQNLVTLPHSAQRKHHFKVKKGKVKITKVNPQKEIFFGMVASEISTKVNTVTTVWRYCNFLSIY